ncbi:MAG: hypothetical protein RJA61_284 [Candidatus Parcubacteria bacterium]
MNKPGDVLGGIGIVCAVVCLAILSVVGFFTLY